MNPRSATIVRAATPADSAAIAGIYNQGIEDRIATFETRPREPSDIQKWFDGRHPIVVVEAVMENAAVNAATVAAEVIAFASTSTYRPRGCYAGIAEVSAYVAREWRGRGAGRVAMNALFEAARAARFHKLVSRIFPENTASLRMTAALGFREVGVYRRHGQLDGVWRDVVIVEKLL
jgi:L-amino acid N-acyltransferase YncA